MSRLQANSLRSAENAVQRGRPGSVASSTNGWSLASLGAGEFLYENVTIKISRVSIDDTVSAEDSMCFTTERRVNKP